MSERLTTIAQITHAINKKNEGLVYTPEIDRVDLRLASGIAALDLCLGGGIPRGHISMIYGKRSSGKSNLVCKYIAQHQQLFPELKCILIDAENDFRPNWAQLLGVNIAELHIILSNVAEVVANAIEQYLYAEDLGLLIIDSISALLPDKSLNESMDKQSYAGASAVLTRLLKKAVFALMEHKKEGRFPTIILVNQPHQKIGGLFPEETLPGGVFAQHISDLIMRLAGTHEEEKLLSTKEAAPKTTTTLETNVIVKRAKFPIIQNSCVYYMSMNLESGQPIGETFNKKVLGYYLKELNLLTQEKNKEWQCLGYSARLQEELLDQLVMNQEEIQNCIIAVLFDKYGLKTIEKTKMAG